MYRQLYFVRDLRRNLQHKLTASGISKRSAAYSTGSTNLKGDQVYNKVYYKVWEIINKTLICFCI